MTLLSRGVRDKKHITHTRRGSRGPTNHNALGSGKSTPLAIKEEIIQCPRCKEMVPVFQGNQHACRRAWLKEGMLDSERLESTLRRVSGLSGQASGLREV